MLVSYYVAKVDCIEVTLPPVSRLETQDDVDDRYRAERRAQCR